MIRGPLDQNVVEGSSVTFQCRVGGDPMPDVLWRRTASGGNMPLGGLLIFRSSHFEQEFLLNLFLDRVHILEDRSLRLENVNLSDEGEYSCEADNVVGSITAVGSLVIYCRYFDSIQKDHSNLFCTFL